MQTERAGSVVAIHCLGDEVWKLQHSYTTAVLSTSVMFDSKSGVFSQG